MVPVAEAPEWRIGRAELSLERPLGAGIVNVTDDSFFEGARSATPQRAVRDGLALLDAGFDLLDVGAVKAAPGPPVVPEQEAARLIPAIEGLAARAGAPICADTFEPRVAAAALEAGADVINDTGGAGDPELLDVVADAGCGLVVMHIEGPPRTARPVRSYDDPVEHLKRFFADRIEAAVARGVDERQIAIDPGLDFDLGVADGLTVLRRLGELGELGRPVYLAASRKDLLGAVLAGSWERRAPAAEREWATAAAVALTVANGAAILRLHDASALQAMRVADAIVRGAPGEDGERAASIGSAAGG